MDELEELTALLSEELSELRAELALLRKLTIEIQPREKEADFGETLLPL